MTITFWTVSTVTDAGLVSALHASEDDAASESDYFVGRYLNLEAFQIAIESHSLEEQEGIDRVWTKTTRWQGKISAAVFQSEEAARADYEHARKVMGVPEEDLALHEHSWPLAEYDAGLKSGSSPW